jgi:hypothetical protein
MAVLPLEIVSDGGAIWSRTRTCPDMAYLLQLLHPAAPLAASPGRLANIPPLLITPDGTQKVCHGGPAPAVVLAGAVEGEARDG